MSIIFYTIVLINDRLLLICFISECPLRDFMD